MNSKQSLLEVLRTLNEQNIVSEEVRNSFFKKLIVRKSDRHWSETMNSYGTIELHKNNIIHCLPEPEIIDKQTYLELKEDGEYKVIYYFFAIMYFKKIVEKDPAYFTELKGVLLWGLIMKYIIQFKDTDCKSQEILDVLNKLMVILGEHIYRLPPSNDMPYIIDEKFLNKLIEAINNHVFCVHIHSLNQCFKPIVMELLEHKFGKIKEPARFIK